MELEILQNEEKRMNMILFLFLVSIPVVAFFYVLLFNGGGIRDAVVLLMVVSALIIKALENSWVQTRNICIFRYCHCLAQ